MAFTPGCGECRGKEKSLLYLYGWINGWRGKG